MLQYKEDWKYFEKIVRSFDEKGNLLEETCYGNDGDMALNPDLSIEYLNVKWSIEQHDLYNYDENGHLLVSIENDRRSGRSKKVVTNYVYGDIMDAMPEIPVDYDENCVLTYDKSLIQPAGSYGTAD